MYIVRCADDSLYTGYAQDLARREEEHNSSPIGAKYTRGRRPVKLIYSEHFPTRSAALKREAEIKKLTRTQKLSLVKQKTR